MPSKITGVDILIDVNLGTEESPDWKAVGGQRGASLSESREMVSVTHKGSDGQYNENEYGYGEWSISADGVYVENEEAYFHLVSAMRTKEKVRVRWTEGGTKTFAGRALVNSRDLDGPYDGEATYSMELQGDGKPDTPEDEYSNNLSALTGIEENATTALSFIPSFSGGTYDYVTNVDSSSGWIKLTPTADAGTITVNGAVVSSGNETGEIALGDPGSITDVTIKVREENKVPRTYKLTVAREA